MISNKFTSNSKIGTPVALACFWGTVVGTVALFGLPVAASIPGFFNLPEAAIIGIPLALVCIAMAFGAARGIRGHEL